MYLDDIASIPAYSASASEVAVEVSSIRVTRQSPEPPAETAELSVLTYNVRGLPWPLALNRGKALREIGRELAALRHEGRQPDVVLIQEGFRDEVATLVRESGYRYWARGPGRGERTAFDGDVVRPRALLKGEGLGKVFGAGLHVLSDTPILDVRTAAYNNCAGFDCLANKGAMLVRVQPDWSPTPIDVVNTHMNARKASGAPRSRSLPAHHGQTRELAAFLNAHRDPDHPLLVGGDFNVRNSAARYDFEAQNRPYAVVSEYCSRPGSGCGEGAPDAGATPWLKTQDLQGFGHGALKVQPVKSEFLFAQGAQRLSDHDAYLVRYQLSWNTQTLTAAYRPDPSVKVKAHKLGFKVSWAP
jgi:endonuclease/exonuclease/phosphatase family metal-dependent hydrolase